MSRRTTKTKRPPTVHVVSLGCPKNLVDSEQMCGQLGAAGFAFTNAPDEANVLLINTCGFIEPACEEARAEIRDAIAWKRRKRGRRIAVAGCWVQRFGERAAREFPEIDLLLDLNAVPDAARRIQQSLTKPGNPASGLRGDEASYLADHTVPRLLLTPPSYAYLKIADGCDHHCRFCTIPAIRGRQRSRYMDSIRAEAQSLLDCGVRELNLIAQDTTRYGVDLANGADLATLLRELDSLGGEFWVRLLYTHPAYFSEDVVAAMAECERVVPYVDLPLQHISDSVLTAMGRRTPAADIRTLLHRLRTAIPDIALRTTFLVGYPGETEADFEELLGFVEETRFQRLGCFAFCPEEGTPAAKAHAHDPVPTEIADERRDRIMALQQTLATETNRAMLGDERIVLVDGLDEDGAVRARTTMDAPEIDDSVILSSDEVAPTPDFHRVRIVDATAYDLVAELSA